MDVTEDSSDRAKAATPSSGTPSIVVRSVRASEHGGAASAAGSTSTAECAFTEEQKAVLAAQVKALRLLQRDLPLDTNTFSQAVVGVSSCVKSIPSPRFQLLEVFVLCCTALYYMYENMKNVTHTTFRTLLLKGIFRN